jgi:hypothetical protein
VARSSRSPARRHARPDGQAVGRDHRDADHRELPRGPDGPPVLHLDARRPQGPGRHGAQDRQLGLPDASSGRRRAGRIVTEFDCGTRSTASRSCRSIEGGEIIERLGERILGRVALEDIVDPYTGEVLVEANSEIDEDHVKIIENSGIDRVKIRSVLTCETRRGICALCYGRDLARGHMVNIGEAVGVIAAQSIGEPGTQLTMRTFHIGGAAARGTEQSSLEARNEGTVKLNNVQVVKKKDGTGWS